MALAARRTGRRPPGHALSPRQLLVGIALPTVVAFGQGTLLHYTDAYAPFWNCLVLAVSVLSQLLMMQRQYES